MEQDDIRSDSAWPYSAVFSDKSSRFLQMYHLCCALKASEFANVKVFFYFVFVLFFSFDLFFSCFL